MRRSCYVGVASLVYLLYAGCAGLNEPYACAKGRQSCSGSCVDVEQDNENCGACGVSCRFAENCVDGSCSAIVQDSATCSDGTVNGNETDVDCGGGDCDPCGLGDDCDSGADCQSGHCDATSRVCAEPPATCSDGIMNGHETDVDCGGPSCGGCGIGDSCSVGSDCAGGVCHGGTCAYGTHCLELLQAGAETDGVYTIDVDGAGVEPPFEVYCDMTTNEGGWTRLYYEDFEDATTISGWSWTNETTTCGTFGNILGGYGETANGSNAKTYDLMGLSHTEVRVELDYIKIDSWDNGVDWAYLQIDGTELYRLNLTGGVGPICGAHYYDRRLHLDYTVDHEANTINVRPGMEADQGALDESWGVDNVEVWVR